MIAAHQRQWQVAATSVEVLARLLLEDGYGAEIAARAAEVQQAARTGCLLWGADRLVTTDASRIDAVPQRRLPGGTE